MTAHPTARAGAALFGVAGALLLAGCSGAAEADAPGGTSAGPDGPYADGTYTAEGSYRTPETVEKLSVTLTVADDVVTQVAVSGDPQAPETRNFQGQFIVGIADVVVGRPLEGLDVDRVAGSSLTSEGFDEAVGKIREEAAAAAR